MYDIILRDTADGDLVSLEEFYNSDGLVKLFVRILREVKVQHRRNGRSRQSLVMLALLADGLDFPVVTSTAPLFGPNSLDVVLELLEKVAMLLSSRQQIEIDAAFHLHVTIVDGPNPDPRTIWVAGRTPRLPTNFSVARTMKRKLRQCMVMPDLTGTRYEDACLLAALAVEHARQNKGAADRRIQGVWQVLEKQRKYSYRKQWSRKATEALFMAIDHFVTTYRLNPADFAPAGLNDALRQTVDQVGINLSVLSMSGGCLPIFKHPANPDPARGTVAILAIPESARQEESRQEEAQRERREREEGPGSAKGAFVTEAMEVDDAESPSENEAEEEGGGGAEERPNQSPNRKWTVPAEEGALGRVHHAALVLNVQGLTPTHKTRCVRCPYCHRSYSKRFAYAHRCTLPQCSTCRRVLHQSDHFTDASTPAVKCVRPAEAQEAQGCCKFCRRPVYSKQCLRFHRHFCGKHRKFCTLCGKTYDTRSNHQHRCGERFCRICKKYVMEDKTMQDGRDHACVMTKPTPPRTTQPLAFFDMETLQDEHGRHVANAVGLSFESRKNPGTFSEIYFYDREIAHSEDGILQEDVHREEYWPSDRFRPKHPQARKTKKETAHPDAADASSSSALSRFVSFFFTTQFSHYTLIGHAAARFDSILLLQELLQRGILTDPLFDGNKALQLRVPKLNIRVIDSYRYIKLPLAKFATRFPSLQKHDMHKGTFPFRFNRPENYNYEGPLPDRDHYLDQFSNSRAVKSYEEERQRWEGREDWNFRQQLHQYLAQDVRVLRGGCLAFSRELYEFQEDLGGDQRHDAPLRSFHPFSSPFFTISSFVHALWRYYSMPPDQVVLATNQRNAVKTSRGEMEWISYLAARVPGLEGMQSAYHSAEGQVRVGRYSLDGVCGKVAYEFNGCLAHYHAHCHRQCPKSASFSPADPSPFGKSMHEAGEAWKRKVAFLQWKGYRVETMWECEWERRKREDPDVKAFLEGELYGQGRRPVERLRLRTGLRGGRTESFRLRYDSAHASCAGRKMYYVDKNSLYPSMAVFKTYPVGPSETLIGHRLEEHARFEPGRGFVDPATGGLLEGIVQATLLPPDALFLPILPVKVGDKLKFGLCGTCLSDMREGLCPHDDRQRYITGEWTTPEIVFAVECGYRLVQVWEMHAYRQTSGLFCDFYTRLARMKLESEGFPAACRDSPELQQDHVDALNEAMPGLQLERDRVVRNEPRRTFAKNLSNSGLGKFSQNDLKANCVYVSCYEDLHRLAFETPHLRIKHVDPLTEDLAEVGVEPRDECLGVHRNTQVVVYAFVTAYARIDMMRDMRRLMQAGARIFYTDTDSIIFDCEDARLEDIKTAFNMDSLAYGAYKFETRTPIVRFATLGAKNYAFLTAGGESEVKVRGFVLSNAAAAALINLDSMWDMLEKFARQELDTVRAEHFTMRIDRKQQTIKNATMVKQYANNVFDKRYIVSSGDATLTTAPFGARHYNYDDVR